MSTQDKKIKIVAVIGSVRPDNMTAKVLDLVVDEIKKNKHINLEVIDPAKIHLVTPGEESDASVKALQKLVSSATGIILSTPEYQCSSWLRAARKPRCLFGKKAKARSKL